MSDEKNVLVCVGVTDPLQLADNIISPCVKCGEKLQLRPHWNLSQVDPTCIKCMGKIIAEADGEIDFTVTPRTVQELMAAIASEDTKH